PHMVLSAAGRVPDEKFFYTFRQAASNSCGFHPCLSPTTRIIRDTPYSSPFAFAASEIPSVYKTKLSPGPRFTRSIVYVLFENIPSGSPVEEIFLTPAFSIISAGKCPALPISISPDAPARPHTSVAYCPAIVLSQKT